MLSTRRLYFLEDQVVFECNEMYAHEALKPRSLDILATIRKSGWDFVYNDGFTPWTTPYDAPWPWGTPCPLQQKLLFYQTLIRDYSRRALAYQTDAYNVFQGLCNYMRRTNFALGQIWGIIYPLCQLPEEEDSAMEWFISALLWLPYRRARRRAEFPSWSWLGWETHAHYDCTYREGKSRILGIKLQDDIEPCSTGMPRVLLVTARFVPGTEFVALARDWQYRSFGPYLIHDRCQHEVVSCCAPEAHGTDPKEMVLLHFRMSPDYRYDRSDVYYHQFLVLKLWFWGYLRIGVVSVRLDPRERVPPAFELEAMPVDSFYIM